MEFITINDKEFYLGRLCKGNHDWNDTGKTLRRVSNSECPQCSKDKYNERIKLEPDFNKKRYQKHKEYSLNYQKQWRKRSKEVMKKQSKKYQETHVEELKEYRKNYYLQNKEVLIPKMRRYNKKYYLSRKEEIDKKHRNYYKQNRFLALLRCRKRRANKMQIHKSKYTLDEIKCLKDKFKNKCSYCRKEKILHLDHFIPMSKGGPDCLGNIVPACKSCNSSKHNSDPMEWYKSQEFYSPTQWKKILKILGKTELNYTQIPLF